MIQIACNQIGGNVEVKANAVVRDVRLPGNTVAGNVTLMDNTSSNRFVLGSFQGGGGDLPANSILPNVIVTGNSNSIDRIIVGSHPDTEEGNTIFGHLTVMENTSADQVLISLNSVIRNLKCEDNNPGATLNGNTVVGEVHCGN